MWNMKHFAIIFVGKEVMHEIFPLFLWNLKQSKVVNYVHFWFEETLIILTSKVLQCCWGYNAHMHDIDINFQFEKNTTNDIIQWFFTSYTKLGIILCPNSELIFSCLAYNCASYFKLSFYNILPKRLFNGITTGLKETTRCIKPCTI